MDETRIVGGNVAAARAGAPTAWVRPWSGISWSGVIAGAFTAIAVSVIVLSLGSGIGMALVSPYSYSSPSAGTMTIIGALWLVFAQAVGFAVGGYVAGRVRRPASGLHDAEVKFRDGANGLVVWAIGVVVMALIIGTAVEKAGSAAGSTATGLISAATQSPSMDYFTDTLLRPDPQTAASNNTGGTPAASTPGGETPGGTTPAETGATNPVTNDNQRSEIGRILVTSLGPNGVSNDDRTYLVQMVSARTGMSQADAQHRVDDVINRVKEDTTKAADAARKAAAFLSFWTFMSLLFGAVCATLGGVLGGDLRDDYATRYAAATPLR